MAQQPEMHSTEGMPRMLDRYQLLRKLAVGGMAELFLAKQSGLEGFEKAVVVKQILRNLSKDQEFVSMFLDEARIAAKLSHPNVVQIYDLGKADGSYYIAMEYVSGRNCQHLIGKEAERGTFVPVEHTCQIIAGVCAGLHYAHNRKDFSGEPLSIIHRDVSPQNILVSFGGNVKVVDFGIAKASTQIAQTRAGVLKGKYAYMSPEQVRGSRMDHRSDIFSLGLVMYEMLTGKRPFERASGLDTLKAIVQDKPVNPREYNKTIPMAVVRILSRALEKDPSRRYKSAQEMQLALEEYLHSCENKTSTVRVSKYMKSLFADELASEEGSMNVDGVGQVIIPTSRAKFSSVAAEEIDAKTMSRALSGGTDDTAALPGSLDSFGSFDDDPEEATAIAPPPVSMQSIPRDPSMDFDDDPTAAIQLGEGGAKDLLAKIEAMASLESMDAEGISGPVRPVYDEATERQPAAPVHSVETALEGPGGMNSLEAAAVGAMSGMVPRAAAMPGPAALGQIAMAPIGQPLAVAPIGPPGHRLAAPDMQAAMDVTAPELAAAAPLQPVPMQPPGAVPPAVVRPAAPAPAVAPTIAPAPAAPGQPTWLWVAIAGMAVLLLALGATAVYMLRGPAAPAVTYTTLQVTSEPPGAQLTLGGRKRSERTPVTLAVPVGQPQPVVLELKGYETHNAVVTAKVGEAAVLNATLKKKPDAPKPAK